MFKQLTQRIIKGRTDWQFIAISDLGSNTARLVILRSIPGYAYRLEDELREVVRLREGMTDGRLSDAAMERGLSTLDLFKRFCGAVGVDMVIPTATSAVRDATNGSEFVQRVEQEVGWKLRVLSGEREAHYGVIGALNEVPITNGYVLDIGGGSAQLSEVRDGSYRRGDSVRLGALALTERFVKSDPPKSSELKVLQSEIEKQLQTFTWAKPSEGWKLVGLGGTIRNLAKIESKRQNYPLENLHGFALTGKSVKESIDLFDELPLKQRKSIPGLSDDRADIIGAGARVVAAFMDYLKVDELTISENGLREGIFFEQFWRDQPVPIADDVRRFSVLNMARIYQYQPDHAAHVRMLCQRLFADLKTLHQYGPQELELLEAAALLHDLGTIINYNDHHKHSQMLIISSGLAGYTPRETAIISLLARYHRKGTPSWEGFQSLMQDGDEILLTHLAAILRMAEFLERGRSGIVSDIEAAWDDDSVTITLLSDRTPAVELWDAERNAAPLFETAFGRTVHLQLGHSTQG